MTSFEKLDEALGLLNQADLIISQVLGPNNQIRGELFAVMDLVSDEMAEVEFERE